jgi:hypothetical protein
MSEVRKELALEAEQAKQMDTLRDQFRREVFQLMPRSEGPPFLARTPEAIEQWSKARVEIFKKITETETQLAQILPPESYQRLLGLLVQRENERALMGSGILDERLAISQEQRNGIDTVVENARKQIEDLFPPLADSEARPAFDRKDLEVTFGKIEKEQQKAQAAVRALLTKEQLNQLEEMKGKPFDFPKRSWGRDRRDRGNDRHERGPDRPK